MRDVRQLRLPWPDYGFSTAGVPFPVEAIQPPRSYPGPVYVRIPERGTALVSDAIDRSLAGGELSWELASQPYRLPGPLRASAPYVLAACNAGRVVFNGDVVGMRGDPLPADSGARAPLGLHRAGFFDAQCSNDLCTLRITHRGTGREFDPRRALLTGADGRPGPRARGGCGTPDRAGPAPADPGGRGAATAPRRARSRVVAGPDRGRGSRSPVSRGLVELQARAAFFRCRPRR